MSLFAPVEQDIAILSDNLKQLVGAKHPILGLAAERLFGAGGKRIRPAIVFLVGHATMRGAELTVRHRRLAEITEMIHTASLVHDDVVDEAETRRGIETVHSVFGNRIAVLAGDFLFAQSSWYLANLDNLEVVKLLSEVIKDFAEGEIQQGLNRFDTELTIDAYLQKSYYKTASLIANSCKAAAILSDPHDASTAHQMYTYGNHLGIAFQVVDDIFDFTASADVLGKPTGSDLSSGHLTAPTLFAMEEKPYLRQLIDREFAQENDLAEALALVNDSQGIARSKELASYHSQQAVASLRELPSSEAKDSLLALTDYVLSRMY
ncbi:solanesyl diphosphate synthase [Romeriopsis navalis]